MSEGLSERVVEDLKAAMRSKDAVALAVLRGLKTAMQYAAIEKSGAEGKLDEAEAVAVVRKQVKQRQDSIESFESAGRAELAERERAEMVVLERYLPAALSEEELGALVDEVVTELGATSRKEMGAVMKVLNERAAGRADGKTLAALVGQRLAG